jgi:regulatory protein
MQPKKRWKEAPTLSSSASTGEAAERLYTDALKWLARQQRSTWEIEKKLLESCRDRALVDSVIERLKVARYLDDRSFAELFIQSHRQQKCLGRSRIAAELRSRGLDPTLIKQVLESVYSQTDEHEPLARALDKKLRTLQFPMDAKKLSRLYNHLLRRGFPEEAVRRAIEQRFEASWDRLRAWD